MSSIDIYREIETKIGHENIEKISEKAINHDFLYQGITEQLLFSSQKYERMDMAFLSKISSLNYGEKNRIIVIGCDKKCEEKQLQNIADMLKNNYDIYLSTIWEQLILCILPEKLIELKQIRKIYHDINDRFAKIRIAGSSIKSQLENSDIGLQEAIRTYDMIDTMKKHKEDIMFYEDLGIYGLLYDLNNVNVITDIVTALKVRRMIQILDHV